MSRHPKCKGYFIALGSESYDYDCGYNTVIACDECKYCCGPDGKPIGRKDPAVKCNQEIEK